MLEKRRKLRREKKEKEDKQKEKVVRVKGKSKKKLTIKEQDQEEAKKEEVDPPPAEFFFDTSVLAADYYKRHRAKIMDNKILAEKAVNISFVENLAVSEQSTKKYSNQTWMDIDNRLEETKILNEVTNASMIVARAKI